MFSNSYNHSNMFCNFYFISYLYFLGITLGQLELMKCSTVLTTLAISVSIYLNHHKIIGSIHANMSAVNVWLYLRFLTVPHIDCLIPSHQKNCICLLFIHLTPVWILFKFLLINEGLAVHKKTFYSCENIGFLDFFVLNI